MIKNNIEHTPSSFPVVIIGGGIVGAGCFRDLALHGVDTLLVDKFDFTSQTSQSSSKMLHGGIRYLENMDFSLVWEALHEKNLWLKMAPHLCYPEKFYLPIYKESTRPLWMIHAGVILYDILSSFKNVPHDKKNARETLKSLKLLREKGLKGAGIYSDAIVDDAKLTLENIYDGLIHPGSYACNYTSLISATKKKDYTLLTLKDEITGKTKDVKAGQVIFATGPFTDKLMDELKLFKWTPKMLLSKGSHLWFDRKDFPLESPVVLTPNDGRVIFVIPQGERVLVGTTEQKASATFNQQASDIEIDYLLKNLDEFFPKAQLKREHIKSSFAGLRPLVKEDESGDLGKTARHHKIYQPMDNAFVIIGGKYTTFRVMASDVVSLLMRKMGKAYDSQRSCTPFRYQGQIKPWTSPSDVLKGLNAETLQTILERELPKTWEDLVLRRMGVLNLEENPYIEFLEEHRDLIHQYIKRPASPQT